MFVEVKFSSPLEFYRKNIYTLEVEKYIYLNENKYRIKLHVHPYFLR